jgi:RHS repeat-associated protein
VLELDASAAVISYEEYFPYGSTSYQAVRRDVEVSAKRYRYTGKERDEESGLSVFTVRYYISWLGRWTSCDPAGMVDGINLFAFVQLNPLSRHDRDGRQSQNSVDDTFTFIRNQAAFQAGGGSQTAASPALRAQSHPPTFNPRSSSPFGTAAHAEATKVLADIKKLGVLGAQQIYSEVAVNRATGVVTQIGGRPITGHHNLDLVAMPQGQNLVPGQSTLAAGQADVVGDLKYGRGSITQQHASFGQRAVTVNSRFNATPGPPTPATPVAPVAPVAQTPPTLPPPTSPPVGAVPNVTAITPPSPPAVAASAPSTATGGSRPPSTNQAPRAPSARALATAGPVARTAAVAGKALGYIGTAVTAGVIIYDVASAPDVQEGAVRLAEHAALNTGLGSALAPVVDSAINLARVAQQGESAMANPFSVIGWVREQLGVPRRD